MKSITRIVLPILLVAGIAFGMTYIMLHSSEDPDSTNNSDGSGGGVRGPEQPLKYSVLIAAAPKEQPNDRGEMEIPSNVRHLKYWNSAIEVGASGHFEFWCQNRHPEQVTVRVNSTNCTCAGVDVAVLPPEAYRDYLVSSAVAGGPMCPAPGPAAILAHISFNQRLEWKVLHDGSLSEERRSETIPAASTTFGPQLALVRVAWTGKGDAGPKSISAHLFTHIGNSNPSHAELKVETNVVPAFDMIRRDGPKQWTPGRDIVVGELGEKDVAKQTIYLASATRSFLLTQVENESPDPCVTWTQPEPASIEELANLREFLQANPSPLGRLKGLYKMEVTVRERAEFESDGRKNIRQLDLGPFERKLNISAANGGSMTMRVRGRVIGEVTFPAGADSGRIELGNSFPSDQDRTRDVIILADRPGLELTLDTKETGPHFLKVRLDPLEPLDGRMKYRLRVTVPKNNLVGSLPDDSVVVLKTNGPVQRRLRLPVRGMAFDAGGPRL